MNDKNTKHYIRLERHKWPDEIAREKQQRKRVWVTILVAIVFFVGGFGTSMLLTKTSYRSSATTGSEKFNEIYSTLVNEWYYSKEYDDIETELMDNAILGMLNNKYDKHTNYLNKESTTSYLQSLNGSFVGIGISYTKYNGNVVIERVYNDSPAINAGIEPGDILTKIDGQSVKGLDLDEIKELATGEEGTSVTVEVLRNNKSKSFEMIRKSIGTTVYGYTKDNVGILEISSFSENSAQEVGSYLSSFKDKDIDNLIIDLRDNGGGYLKTMIGIASYFMDSGTVCLQEENNEGKVTKYKTERSPRYKFKHIVMLVNSNTASASEALTACMKENINAKVVGINTYGKGTVQHPMTFDDGTYFKYTVSEWLTPKGEKINGQGIAPDYEVHLDEALTFSPADDTTKYKVDSVGDGVKNVQVYLKFLGYDVDRTDGYFSEKTLSCLHAYQQDNGLKQKDVIDADVYTKLLSSSQKYYHDNKATLDVQMKKAIEVANGK